MVQSAVLPPLVRGVWTPMSYEEFLVWAPEGTHTEWTDGEGIVYVSTGDRHQWMIALLYNLLDVFAELYGIGRAITAPYPAILWPGGPHREPDVMFVATARLDQWTHQGFHGAPDFVVEALSEETAREDQGRKRREFETAGAHEYVMADARPNRHDFLYLRRDAMGHFQDVVPDAHGRYHSAVVPGFWIDPNWFRQDPLPRFEDLLIDIAPDAYEAWITAKLRARRKPDAG